MRGGTIHVWWATPGAAGGAWGSRLDAGERQRLTAYACEVDRLRFITGVALIRSLYAAELGVGPGDVPLERSCPDCDKPHGKVRLAGEAGKAARIEASISHSGSWVVLAACRDFPLGVDVEVVDDSLDHLGLGRLALTPAELRMLASIVPDKRAAAFARRWVRKEAVVKSLGTGLRTSLTDFEVTPPNAPPALVGWHDTARSLSGLRLYDIDTDGAHQASLAVIGGPPMIVVNKPASELLCEV